MLKIIPTWVWLVVAVALFAAGVGVGYHAGSASGAKKVAAIQLKDAATFQRLAELTAQAAEAVRAQEHAQAAAVAAIGAKYEQDKIDADHKADAVAGDLRDGYLRLRRQWRCPAAVDLPEATASTGAADGDAELRDTGAGNLVRIAAQADAQIHGLQQALKSCSATQP